VYPVAFDYAAPATVEEAIACLRRHADDDAKVLAGGQSLIPLMKLRFARPGYLVDINRIEALASLRHGGGGLRIGALVREADLDADPLVRRDFPVLRDATRVIADPVVRNLATVGGNLAHGDPANDHPAVMIALGAEIVAHGPAGVRVIPAGEFFLGLFETALGPAEILTEIRVPPPRPGTGAAYAKFERQAGDFAIAGVAARVTVEGGTVTDARLVCTNVGATPRRAEAAERALVGHAPTAAGARSAGQAAAGALDLADDLRGSAAYKRRVVAAVTARALALATARATGPDTGAAS
jgi:carbon-monoxide dehydrogenase medium subunit